MREGKIRRTHLKDHQLHGRLSLVGGPYDGVDGLDGGFSGLVMNRLLILHFHGQRALQHIDDRGHGMGVPLPDGSRLDSRVANSDLELISLRQIAGNLPEDELRR
jgi:hypothetical protein